MRQFRKDLVLFNLDPDDPISQRLSAQFDTQNVTVSTERTASGAPGGVAVLSDRDGVIAVTDVASLRELCDHQPDTSSVTGVADVAHEDILAPLKETTFTSHDTEQLLYASREIEDRARRVGRGTIHAGFQDVSTIATQRHIYTDLSRHGIEVHAYGVPDAEPPTLGDGSVHAAQTAELAATWFVIFDGGGTDTQKSALLARETAADKFDGIWTYDPTIVDRLLRYLEVTYLSGRPDTPAGENGRR